MKNNWLARVIAGGFFLALMAANTQAIGAKISKPLVMGEIVTLHSDILSQDRILWIYVPKGYKDSLSRYPVLFLLDGERAWPRRKSLATSGATGRCSSPARRASSAAC